MDAFVFRFPAKQLKAIDRGLLGFLVASGHCCNELVTLLPYLVFEHSIKTANEVETAFILVRRFTMNRILISKIVEYNELCSKFLKQPHASGAFYDELRSRYANIKATIEAAKWAKILRNKTSFHYDRMHAAESLDQLNDDHPMRLIAGQTKSVTLFDFAEEIVSRPIFEKAGGGDIGVGMDVANKFVSTLADNITKFHAETMSLVFKRSGMVTKGEKCELREKYCGTPMRHRIPITIRLVAASGSRGG